MLVDLRERVERSNVVGCAVGILRRDQEPEFVFHGTCANGGKAISSDVVWEAASLSKPVVALLAADFALSNPTLLTRRLSTDLGAFGTDGDELWNEVNSLHLLTHSSGLPNWRTEGQPLGFESSPGTAGYSGEGYELLLSELSLHSKLGAGEMLARHLQKLGMTGSSFTPERTTTASAAVGHDESGRPVPKHHPAHAKASGSLHTTATDYMRFLQIVARPDDVTDRELRDAAKRSAARETEVIPGYGRTLGWAFAGGDDGDVLSQHGDNLGFKHIAAVRPSTGEAIVVFTNDDNGQPLYRELCRDFLGVELW